MQAVQFAQEELLEISSDCQKTRSHPARPDVLSYHLKLYHDRILSETFKFMGPSQLQAADNTRLYKLIELSLSYSTLVTELSSYLPDNKVAKSIHVTCD